MNASRCCCRTRKFRNRAPPFQGVDQYCAYQSMTPSPLARCAQFGRHKCVAKGRRRRCLRLLNASSPSPSPLPPSVRGPPPRRLLAPCSRHLPPHPRRLPCRRFFPPYRPFPAPRHPLLPLLRLPPPPHRPLLPLLRLPQARRRLPPGPSSPGGLHESRTHSVPLQHDGAGTSGEGGHPPTWPRAPTKSSSSSPLPAHRCRGIRMRAYSPYVVTVVPDINLPANYSESYLGAPVADKVLPYVNCERDPAVASQCQGADLPCDGTCFNSPNFFATQNFAAQASQPFSFLSGPPTHHLPACLLLQGGQPTGTTRHDMLALSCLCLPLRRHASRPLTAARAPSHAPRMPAPQRARARARTPPPPPPPAVHRPGVGARVCSTCVPAFLSHPPTHPPLPAVHGAGLGARGR